MPRLQKPVTPQSERKAKIHAKRIAHYSAHRSAVGEALLLAALRSIASMDAVQTVNRLLDANFGLVDVTMNAQESEQSALTVLRAEVIHILASQSTLPPDVQAKLVDRIVARMIPLRDNAQAPGRVTQSPRQLRTQDLEKLIERDLQAAYPPKDKVAVGAR